MTFQKKLKISHFVLLTNISKTLLLKFSILEHLEYPVYQFTNIISITYFKHFNDGFNAFENMFGFLVYVGFNTSPGCLEIYLKVLAAFVNY